MYAVVQQAEDRTQNHIRTLDSYLDVRRDTIGAKPSFAILELEMDLPDDVFNHPTLENLRTWVIDMLCIGNDICSYNIEQARGDDLHNMVTIVMHQFDTDVQGAMEYIGKLHDRLAGAFLLTKDRLPSWGEPTDSQVARYVHGLGNWVRANDQWSFESQRYFGTKGLDIMKHRVVKLLPKADHTDGIVINIPSEDQITTTVPTESLAAPVPNQTHASPIIPRKVSHGGHNQLDMRFQSLLSTFIPSALPLVVVVLFAVYMTVSLSFAFKAYGFKGPWAATFRCPDYCMANYTL